MPPIIKIEIPEEIRGAPFEFMKKHGEKLLIIYGLATKQEVAKPDFYAKGGNGYYFTLMVKKLIDVFGQEKALNPVPSGPLSSAESLFYMLSCKHDKELITKFGLQPIYEIITKTMEEMPKAQENDFSRLLNSAIYTLKFFNFLVKDGDSLIKTYLACMEIAKICLKMDIPAGAQLSNWQGNLEELVVNNKRVIEKFGIDIVVKLVEFTKGKILEPAVNVDTGLNQTAYRALPLLLNSFGAAPILELARDAEEGFNELISLLVTSFNASYKKFYLKSRTSDKPDSELSLTLEEVLNVAKRTGKATAGVFVALNSFYYLVEGGIVKKDKLFEQLIEIAKKSGSHYKAVFAGLQALSGKTGDGYAKYIVVNAIDLNTKAMKLLEMARAGMTKEGAEKLFDYKDDIKQYGIALFAEIVKAAGDPTQADRIIRALDNPLKQLRRMPPEHPGYADIKYLVEVAKLYGRDAADGLFDLSRIRYHNSIYWKEEFGFGPFIKILKKNRELGSERYEIDTIQPALKVIYEFTSTAEEFTEAANRIIIKKRKFPYGTLRSRSDYLAAAAQLFLKMYEYANKKPEDLEKYLDGAEKHNFDIVFMLGNFRNMSFDKLMSFRVTAYQYAFEAARTLQSYDPNAEQNLINNLDMSGLIADTTNAEKLAISLLVLKALSPPLAKRYASKINLRPEWTEFKRRELDDKALKEAAYVSIIVTSYSDLFPTEKKWQKVKEELISQLTGLTVGAIKPIKTVEDLEDAYKIVEAFRETAPIISNRYRQAIIENVDFAALVRNVAGGVLDPKRLESVRIKLNQIERVLGDEFILFVGMSMSKEQITKENFFQKLEEVSNCCFSKPSGYKDVNNLYEMIGRFQANRLADFLVKNEKNFNQSDKESAIRTLDGMGVTVDFEESTAAKATKQLAKGNIGYVVIKVWEKLTAGEALRKEIIDVNPKKIIPDIKMQDGFGLSYYADSKDKKIATVLIGKNNGGSAKVSYEAEIGNGIDVDHLKERYRSSLVAISVGTFTTGERKLADFAALKGQIISYLVSSQHNGLILFYPDGTASIKDVKNLRKKDISTPGFQMKDEPLQFREKVEDFDIFIKKIKKTGASGMQGQLLLFDGELRATEKGSGVQDKRRAFAIMEDGAFALIDFEQRITLLEEAVLAKKIGVRHLINLDTGMYDFSHFIDKTGKVHKLGTFDSERPTNMIIFHVDIGASVPVKLQ